MLGNSKRFSRLCSTQENLPLYRLFSSSLIGTYQSAVMARDLVLEGYPESCDRIIDQKAAGIGRLPVYAGSWARDAGKSLDQIKEELMEVKPKLRTYFLV